MTLEGSGHTRMRAIPVKVNLLLRDFMQRIQPAPPQQINWTRGHSRKKRALYISSPIGLGHAQRDVAIAAELRKLHPDLQIDWLAQHPVTRVLEARGERIHPASAFLANESSHVESESAEHDLHGFQALRRMDEILIANYMLFHDVVSEEQYDLWIGDEAWELDYYLHENPEEKRAAYAWMTDFVGYLPMPDGGERESFLTARLQRRDDRAGRALPPHPRPRRLRRQPRRHRARHVWLRSAADPRLDRAPLRLRRLCHRLRSRRLRRPRGDPRRTRLPARRARLHRRRRRVGRGLSPAAARHGVVPGGEAARSRPAHDRRRGAAHRSASLPVVEGLEVRPFVYQLYRHLAVCDLAVVQGGLTTAMELTANKRPFLYFPLRHHFEQNFHVRHRLTATAPGAAWTTRPRRRKLSPKPSRRRLTDP